MSMTGWCCRQRAKNALHRLNGVTDADYGSYRVTVSSPHGSVRSDTVFLLPPGP